MKLLYFAHLRTKIGTAEEQLDLPPGIGDVAALLEFLKGRGPKFADALGNRKAVRVAVNQTYVGWDHPLKPGDEVAIFPPVTGG
ncbi:MAG TPA: molybdopterin converting factor subunit 1 [Stellaceae bacterium]|jgi:molybdopterin synthase sulfur carrier subunit